MAKRKNTIVGTVTRAYLIEGLTLVDTGAVQIEVTRPTATAPQETQEVRAIVLPGNIRIPVQGVVTMQQTEGDASCHVEPSLRPRLVTVNHEVRISLTIQPSDLNQVLIIRDVTADDQPDAPSAQPKEEAE